MSCMDSGHKLNLTVEGLMNVSIGGMRKDEIEIVEEAQNESSEHDGSS